ncbi:hypothetical protein M569_04502, partial [Genlisea aurea]
SSRVSPDIDAISDLEKIEVIGWGSGGTVYKAVHRQTGRVYAVKVVRFGDEGVAREAEILRRVGSSEYVVKCVGVSDCGGEPCLVMEYMGYGSLLDVIRRRERLPESVISGVAKSVLKGLRHLHGLRVVHGDIKPSNLLMIDVGGEVKIADFGASRAVGELSAAGAGTCGYMSPERWCGEEEECDGGGYAGDVWSLGIVAMECFAGRFPLAADWVSSLACVDVVVESVVAMGSPEFKSFCRRCLVREWRKRATVDELLLHPFI